MIDKHNITILYTAPTAIRAMMREGDAYVRESDRSSLRLLGSVGEPINLRHGIGITKSLAKGVAQLLIHGGKLKQVEF